MGTPVKASPQGSGPASQVGLSSPKQEFDQSAPFPELGAGTVVSIVGMCGNVFVSGCECPLCEQVNACVCVRE